MTDITPDTALPIAARPPRRDIGIKKRYAAERASRPTASLPSSSA
jgi:hypothetical protein